MGNQLELVGSELLLASKILNKKTHNSAWLRCLNSSHGVKEECPR